MLDDYDPDVFDDEEEEMIDVSEGEGSNRTFIMVAGGIGGLLLISMICMAIYALVIKPRQDTADANQAASQTAAADQATLDAAATGTAIVMAYTPTFTATSLPTDTPTITATLEASPTGEVTGEVTVEATVEAGGPTADPRTATVQALLTQAAAAQTQAAGQLTTATPTSTLVGALPDTGFFDDAGAPMLITLAGILVLVIFMARRLREVNA